MNANQTGGHFACNTFTNQESVAEVLPDPNEEICFRLTDCDGIDAFGNHRLRNSTC